MLNSMCSKNTKSTPLDSLLKEVNELRTAFYAEHGRQPTDEETIEAMEMTPKQYRELIEYEQTRHHRQVEYMEYLDVGENAESDESMRRRDGIDPDDDIENEGDSRSEESMD